MPTSRVLIENKYVAGLAVAGFLLAVLMSHGSLMAGMGALALVGGAGWGLQRLLQRHHGDREHD